MCYQIFVKKSLKATSFQIFAISERSKVLNQIAGKMLKANRWQILWKLNSWQNLESKSLAKFWKLLKANRWQNFENFLKAYRWKTYWKLIAGKHLKINRSKNLKAFWKLNSWQIFEKLFAGEFLLANFWSFLKANRWKKWTSFFFNLLLWNDVGQ